MPNVSVNKVIIFRLLLTFVFAFASPPLLAQTCPLPNDVLGASLSIAKDGMTKALGQGWFENNVGCGDGYTNLMSEGKEAKCVVPSLGHPAKIMIHGLEGSGAAIGLTYDFMQKIDEEKVKAFLSNGTPKEINKIPAPLSSLLKDMPRQSLFVSENEQRLLRIRAEEGSHDRTVIQFFNLEAVERNLEGLLPCAR